MHCMQPKLPGLISVIIPKINFMKKEKLSLKSIKNVLSRAEMKTIMAGSGSGPGGCAEYQQVCGGATGTSCCQGFFCNGAPGGGQGYCDACLGC